MKLTLYIDTSQMDTARVAIEYNEKKYEKVSTSREHKSQMVLPLVEALLGDHKFQISDISEIRVVEGPGSFTGIRVGLSVANTLATLLGISVNGSFPPVFPRNLTGIFFDI